MPNNPNAYAWLDTLSPPLPRMVAEARKLVGIHEKPGSVNDPTIMSWAKEAGGSLAMTYTADSIPWCGLFMTIVAKRAGKTPVAEPLWALNWGKFGEPAGQPALGDVLTFIREGGGHVGLYVAEDTKAYHVIGGNQSDQVCYISIAKERLKSARRPPYMAKPASVRPYIVASSGTISTNEQ